MPARSVGWTGDNGDPDNFLATLFSCSAVGGQLLELVRQGLRGPDQEGQDDQRPWPSAPSSTSRPRSCSRSRPRPSLAHSQVYAVVRKKVSGFVMDPLGIHRFDGVDIAE